MSCLAKVNSKLRAASSAKVKKSANQDFLAGGGKHPKALGQPTSVVWSDIWKVIEPSLKKVMIKNEGTYSESQLLIMERHGYPEETYYTYSYNSVP